MKLLRLFHTLRYLRPVQFYGRLWNWAYRPVPDLRAAPALRVRSGVWQAGCRRRPSMVEADTFFFLNVTGNLRTAHDWDDPARHRLWRYQLHYFDDLNADGAVTRTEWHAALIERWVRENPPGVGTGWEPYPTSLRVVNWTKWVITQQERGGASLDASALDSLAAQTRWLRKRIESHLLGNHLWANAKAFVFAGVFFSGPDADRWLRKGLAILDFELEEQILPDGGHFERSPMYHATLLEDMLDLLNLADAYPGCFDESFRSRLRSTATRMLFWLRVMTHPDGRIALFNDAAFENAPDYAALAEYARRLAVPVDDQALSALVALPDSGYVRLQNSRAVVICDVAPVGPDYLPGHAHADTLSFELSLDARRIFVNGGTSTYEAGLERQRQRGTAAHNTVEVDQLDSSEVWGTFRVARRARPFAVRWGCDESTLWLEGAHDGYRRTVGKVTHYRRWVLEDRALTISDRLDGSFHSAVFALHIHPDVSASEILYKRATALALPDGAIVALEVTPPSGLTRQSSAWHPEFGVCKETHVILAQFAGPFLSTRVSW